MNAKTARALEAVWAAEVAGRLPYQSKAQIYRDLAAEGLLQWGEESRGRDRFGVIAVAGWYLTHAGRLAYCLTCKDDPDATPD